MRALSGYSEWMWAILVNAKPVENRVWSLFQHIQQKDLPLRIYIHGSKTPASSMDKNCILGRLTPEQKEAFLAYDFEKVRGFIMGEATVYRQVTEYNSPWFSGPFGFLFRDGKLYDKPIPFRGRPGLFEVRLEGYNGKETLH